MKDALLTWKGLNAYLAGASERQCEKLLALEKEGKGRKSFMLRIHARLSKMRSGRERIELRVTKKKG